MPVPANFRVADKPDVEQLDQHSAVMKDLRAGSPTMVSMNSPNRFEVGAAIGVVRQPWILTPWSPSHDQRGMLRPLGTSSADWW